MPSGRTAPSLIVRANLRTDKAKRVRIASRLSRQEQCSVGDTLRAWSKFKTGQNFLKNVVNLEIRERVKSKKLDSFGQALRMTNRNRHTEAFKPKYLINIKEILRFAQNDKNKTRNELINLSTYPLIHFNKIYPRPLRERARERGKKAAFTLAEVLITIGIIGVVAAITMPTLIKGISERSNSETQANVAQKITKSMDLMRAAGGLEKTYESTDAFVDELSKYLKITTRCNASNIEKCWPTPTVTTSEGKTFEVKKAKKGKNLQIDGNTTDNVGMILADGTALIMTYNQDAPIIGDGDTVSPSFATLPIGFGRTKKFAYTTSVTDPIDFVMDVNGFRGPNSETIDGKYHDIRSFKVAKFSEGCSGVKIDGIGCVYVLPSFSAIDTCNDKTYDPNGRNNGYCSDNRWAGAKKACQDIGMSLPGTSTLNAIHNKAVSDPSLGLPTSGAFWSSVEDGASVARRVNFDSGNTNGYTKDSSNIGGLCVGD